ncbi:MAG: DUF4625 domain-containing protein [Bacteroidales bacterium]|nr:DUF4625 domain-containing protein [Bacteroidales bacterium]
MKVANIFILIGFGLIFFQCRKEEVDDQKPAIDSNYTEAFPKACDTLYIGEYFIFKSHFTDNEAIGSYSLDIHNNFDHHSHSTEAATCSLDPVKQAINPLIYLENFSFAKGLKSYYTNDSIYIPMGVDAGDYHFHIAVTDQTGWQSIKIFSVKILER